jgi:hypothetical protein
MDAAELADLASRTLIAATATEKWDDVRREVARLFIRWQSDTGIVERLVATREHLAAAIAPDDLDSVKCAEVDQWRCRFADLLDDQPDAAEQVRALVEDIATALSPPPDGPPNPLAEGGLATHGQRAGGPTGPSSSGEGPIAAGGGRLAPAGRPEPRIERSRDQRRVVRDRQGRGGRVRDTHPRRDDAVSRAIQAAVKPGLLAFNPPAEMTQGRKERVEVAIARSAQLRDALVAGLRGPGEVRIEDVPTSAFMGVELRGESFAIVALSPAEQIVAPTANGNSM